MTIKDKVLEEWRKDEEARRGKYDKLSDKGQWGWLADVIGKKDFDAPLKRLLNKHEKLVRQDCEKEIKRLKTTSLQGAKIIKTSMENLKEVRRLQNKLSRIEKAVEGLKKKAKGWVWYKGSDEQKALSLLDDVLKAIRKVM